MTIFDFIVLGAMISGLTTSGLTALFPRFGAKSWLISTFLLPASFASGILALPSMADDWQMAQALQWSFLMLTLAAPLGVLASSTISRETASDGLARHKYFDVANCICSLILAVMLVALPRPSDLEMSSDEAALGLGAYLGALYLILTGVIVLANLEQTLRQAHEHVRWEIKFLLLGIAAIFASIIYLCSAVLLYAPKLGIASMPSMRLFSIVFLLSNFLILVSWRRSSGLARVAVSQKVIYSSITLFSVGIYLIISSLAARWAGQWTQLGIPVEALFFLLSILTLAAILLWTTFRHRAIQWIRRYILAGSYDYRRQWIEAGTRIRSIDPPETAADALIDIVQNTLNAIDVTVWTRLWNPDRLRLLAARGNIVGSLDEETHGIIEKFIEIVEPISSDDVEFESQDDPIACLIRKTQADVIAPLHSDGRIVGLITVGRNRSGRSYGWEAKEFLGVLARFAASELHKTELRMAMLQAKESEAFGTFSTFLLHDLKNFASTLSLIAANAARHQDNPDFQRDAFKSVFDIAERMKQLCSNLRMFSPSSAGTKKPDDLNHLIRTVADNLSIEMSGKLHLALSNLPPIAIDSEEIARLLKNLLLNARAAVSDDGKICLATRRHDSMVEITVEDNGCGIKEEFLKNDLFRPFHTTKSDGLGIGLFHSKKIVELHGGRIDVESEVGKGTTIRVFLPMPQGAPNDSSRLLHGE
jgi:putative PEP-CTERM system histidine kinase